MTGTDCTMASSTESPTLERGSFSDVRTFSGTLSPNVMICCDRVAAGMKMNRQQIAYNRAGAVNTSMYVNHDPFSYWGNNNGMPNAVIVLHKLTQEPKCILSPATIRMLVAPTESTC